MIIHDQLEKRAKLPVTPLTAVKEVLFAITEQERKLFLPEYDAAVRNNTEVRYKWVDTSKLNPGVWEQVLENDRPEIVVTAWSTPSIPARWANGVAESLKYVCHITGSVRSIVNREQIAKGLVVTNWGSSISFTIAEHAILLVHGLLRNIPAWSGVLKSQSYSMIEVLPMLKTRSLRGKRVGLHGFGSIARELVSMLKPYKVDIAAYSQPVPPGVYKEHGVTRCESLEDLFSSSDILIECESLNPQTRGCVTEKVLRLLPESAVFVNVGRAPLVDENALMKLAREKRILVGLDVFYSEPLPSDSPWFEIPGVLLSPHIAGPTWDTYPLCGEFALNNIKNYLSGKPLQGIVTADIYDLLT